MVIGEALRTAALRLSVAGIESARLDAEVLLAALLQKERLFLLMHRDEVLTSEIESAFKNQIERRTTGEPIAYILGQREFMSLPFSLVPGVLIPRPDTETLVELVLDVYPPTSKASMLDICTGSGAVAVSLAYYRPKIQMTAWDISPVCVQTAMQNAVQNGVAERVTVQKRDALQLFDKDKQYDCIVSNPPYIADDVIKTLTPDVRDFEPHLALAGGADGLLFYRHIVHEAPKLLKSGGLLAFEVGHDRADAVCALMENEGCYQSIATRCDLAGIRRVVYGFCAES